MDITTLFILGVGAALLVFGAFFGLIILTLATYVGKNLYPPTRKVSIWAAKLENFLPLLILSVVLLLLIIFILLFALRLPALIALVLILVLFIILALLMLVDMLLGLGVLVYVIRLVYWLYIRWKGLLGGLAPQIMKLKIKHDVKDKDKDWRVHFAEVKKKLSEEAELTRRRISKEGK
jgi:signal transduction histidine kinase